ncbi:MAG: hypothetical protein K2L54_01595 [Clostridiales bacterium]|nr:hypothetical protein [Clostridiales bacterium]
MKEKRIVLSVVLGISLVFLILALITALVDSLTTLTDFTKVSNTDETYYIIYGVMQLVAVIVGIAFIVVYMLKKNDVKYTVIFSACLLLYMILALIVLKVTLPTSEYDGMYLTRYYTMYTSYLGFFVVAAVTALLITVATVLLKKQAAEVSVDGTHNVDTAESASMDITDR